MTLRSPDRLPDRRLPLVVTATSVLLLTAACGGSTADQESVARESSPAATASATTPAPSSEPSPAPSPAPAADGIAITTAASDFGTMLFDQPGQAIYLFDIETAGTPACYGECAVAWPPVLTTGNPQATGDVRADLLGTVQRDDGSTQVTYGGHPLYYYAHEAPGQVLCHDVVEFGGRWLVLTPDGSAAA